MKQYLLVFYFLLAGTIIFGQTSSQKYAILIKKADTFYRLKNYKTSGLTYSQAFKLYKEKVSPDDRFNAACAWALAKMPDSAFFQLNAIVAINDGIVFKQIVSDHDMVSLHKDYRWKPLLDAISKNIADKDAKLNKPLIKELDSIYYEDQAYRGKINDTKINYGSSSNEMKQLWKIINEKDSANLFKVKYILDTYGWLGPDEITDNGNAALFLVIQHSDQKTQEHYLAMLESAVKDGRAPASDLALLKDRVALGQGKKQIYGSQIISDPKTGKDTLAPVEDFENVDKRRASVGLEPLEEYLKYWGIVCKSKTRKKWINPKFANNDFSTAIDIYDSIVGPTNVCKGYGSQLDFKLKYSLVEMYKKQNVTVQREYNSNMNEHVEESNSAWYKLAINHDTILTFDIVPENNKDDYDFILFKCLDPTCINDIKSGKVMPERVCFSANYDKNASTGLSESEDLTFLGAGFGRGYLAGLPVKAGEVYYLMIDFAEIYHRIPKGFTIYFYNYWPQKPRYLKEKKIPKGSVVLENILFESDKTVLLKQSAASLDKLVNQLQTNKTMRIEVSGHTDNTGDEFKNQKLSEGRAKAIVDYLVAKKIDKSRLSYEGFGSKQPIASNNTEEGKQKNRRVEFIIISR